MKKEQNLYPDYTQKLPDNAQKVLNAYCIGHQVADFSMLNDMPKQQIIGILRILHNKGYFYKKTFVPKIEPFQYTVKFIRVN